MYTEKHGTVRAKGGQLRGKTMLVEESLGEGWGC